MSYHGIKFKNFEKPCIACQIPNDKGLCCEKMDFEEELKKSLLEDKIFKEDGEKTFDRTFVPEKPRHRDEILKKLLFDFKIIFKEDKGVNISIRGGGGFGKTMISRFSQEKLTNVAKDLNIKFDSRYYTCFQFRTLGAMLRDYMPENFYISGKGFSISELIVFLIQNLKREKKKLLLIIDEVQNLNKDELMRILSINEEYKEPGESKEYISTILIARDYDWENILNNEPRIAQRLNSTITLPKYTFDQLIDIFLYRRDLAFKQGVLSDSNTELIAEMSRLSGNVYYGIEVMHHAGKKAEYDREHEILPESIRTAAKYVSTEFREPILEELKLHELLSLLAIARVLQSKNKENVNFSTTNEAYDEYQVVCEEIKGPDFKPHVLTVFRKYIQKLKQSKLIHERVRNLKTRGRRAELLLVDFSAELVREKVLDVLKDFT